MTIEISEETVLVALMKTIFSTNENGQYSQEASHLLSPLSFMFRDNQEVKERLEQLVIEALPDLVPLALNKLLQTMIVETSSDYGRTKQVRLASWAQAPLEDVLAVALRAHAEEYVNAKMPDGILDRYDIQVNINLMPKD